MVPTRSNSRSSGGRRVSSAPGFASMQERREWKDDPHDDREPFLGRGQMVRQRPLEPPIVGSSPTAPAKIALAGYGTRPADR